MTTSTSNTDKDGTIVMQDSNKAFQCQNVKFVCKQNCLEKTNSWNESKKQ